MSIDKVEVTNSQGDLLSLSLRDISNGFVVKEIGGLDPVKASIITSNFATMKGQQYQATSVTSRNITITLGYAPNYTVNQEVSDLRDSLYDFFMPGDAVTMTFYKTNGLVITSMGRVEDCSAPLWAQEPETNISIICFDPDFVDPNTVEIHGIFQTTDTAPHTIHVDGSVPTGLTSLSFTAGRTLSEFTIYHTAPNGDLTTMLVSAPLIVGDLVEMCTINGQKSITMTRASVVTSLLWAVSADSTWVQLSKGDNLFYLFAAATNPEPVFVDFNNRYGGL